MTEEQKEKKRLALRAWKLANKEKVKQYRREYAKKYPEKRKEQKKRNALRTSHKRH